MNKISRIDWHKQCNEMLLRHPMLPNFVEAYRKIFDEVSIDGYEANMQDLIDKTQTLLDSLSQLSKMVSNKIDSQTKL